MTDDLHMPSYWETQCGIRIVDPDGWRGKGGRRYDDEISREEFEKRAAVSTTAPLKKP